jgi:hypothetical protein
MEVIWLPDFLLALPLGSTTLWACLAARLPWREGQAEYVIEFGGIWREEPSVSIRLVWDSTQPIPYPWAVPEHTITELAACAVALMLCSHLLSAHAVRVASLGDSFDYRLNDERGWYALEVSGTMTMESGRLQTRRHEKRQQLLQNKDRLNGYVAVVGFGMSRVLFSAHVIGEDE